MSNIEVAIHLFFIITIGVGIIVVLVVFVLDLSKYIHKRHLLKVLNKKFDQDQRRYLINRGLWSKVEDLLKNDEYTVEYCSRLNLNKMSSMFDNWWDSSYYWKELQEDYNVGYKDNIGKILIGGELL